VKRLEVSPTKFGRVIVPGKWEARVPEITVSRSDARVLEMIDVLRRLGMPPMKAEEVISEACQGLFEGSWVTKLKLFTGGAAKTYLEHFGDLEGFDPERTQAAFVPGGDRILARRGGPNVVLMGLFREMRRDAE